MGDVFRTAAILLLRWTPWVAAAVFGVITVNLLLAQTETQAGLNEAMAGVQANVGHARELTRETAEALAPLAATATTLEAMNGGLRTTVADLKEMNAVMGRVLQRQDAIAGRLDSLGARMSTVADDLATVDGQNRLLLTTSADMTRQTAGQAASVEQLSALTEDAIGFLRQLNRKFGFLSQF